MGRQANVSTFLLEKLQRERRAESDKFGSSTSSRHNFDLSASVDLGRASDRASLKSADLEEKRPQSSASMEPGKKKGMGVKEMEQVISTLHKQNFDLKLELFHRREKQSKMEERMESLESESKEMQDMNHKLMDELEKRDKAIEEAVAMIVSLEAKVDQLIKERNMVKQVETEGFYGSSEFDDRYETSPPAGDGADHEFGRREKALTINRMPSFMSDNNLETENLRNVYLGVRGSVLSLRRVSGGPSEADNAMLNGLASPTLSVLSESSFVSVYGQKGGDTTIIPDFDEPLTLPGADDTSLRSDVDGAAKSAYSEKRQPPVIIHHQQHPATGRPVQRDQVQAQDWAQPDARSLYSQTGGYYPQGRNMSKEEKRASLRTVMTDNPINNGGVRIHHDHVLPPTPDTISSSMLRRFKNSNDTLSGQQEANDNSWGAPLEPQDRLLTPEPQAGVSLRDNAPPPPAHSASRQSSYNLDIGAHISRPRSAGDTTTGSRRRRDSWHSDDSDAKSLQSSVDIWIRQGSKPAAEGRTSPDLFGFPTSASNGGGWATDALFDPKAVARRLGAMPSTDHMHDLLSLREALFSPNLPPPPPNRRSSLFTSDQLGGNWSTQLDNNLRNLRRNSDAADLRHETRTPVQQKPQAPSSDKKNYPPNSWQAPRSGINRLFRRSIDKGSTECNTCAVEEATVNSPEAPAWVARSGVVEADRSGATPPPIQFNPRQCRRNSISAGQDVNVVKESVVPPVRPQTTVQPGVVRKWLPGLRQKK